MVYKYICHFPVVLFCLFAGLPVAAQNFTERPEFIKANSNWVFGSWWGINDPNNGTGIDFNVSPPQPLLQTGLTSAEASAAVSDTATGALLFYSNAEKCWDKNYNIMPNGDNLSGNRSTNQGACIVPVIGQPGKFYLFTLMAYNFGNVPPTLSYSIVDMSLNGGLGDIPAGQKNILLDAGPLQESMVAVPGDNCDVWLLVHPYYTPEFRAYHITAAGIDPVPVVSNTGPSLSGTIAAYELGGMAVSPDRSKIVVTSYSPSCAVIGLVASLGGMLVAEFDAAAGQVSNVIYLNDSMTLYCPCFSPDNTKLYCQGMKSGPSPSGPNFSEIVQYAVSNFTPAAVTASKQVIFSATTPPASQLLGMRRRQGKIILADMQYIDAPNQPGAACNLQGGPYLTLDSIASNLNIGSDAVYPLPPDTIYAVALDTAVCAETALQLNAAPGYNSYVWNDGSTGMVLPVTDTGIYWVFCEDACHSLADTFYIRLKAHVAVDLGNDTIVCAAPPLLLEATAEPGDAALFWPDGSTGSALEADSAGRYWVTAASGGCSASDTVHITFRDIAQDLGPDTLFCKGSPVQFRLQANIPAGASATWSDGSTGDALMVWDTGSYWVQVAYPPCTGSDSIVIGLQPCGCAFEVPSAFSPNGDGRNDIFRPVIESACPVRQYTMSVYNRYGQRVYSGADPDGGWDGTFQGSPAELGVYFYQVSFKSGTFGRNEYRKGDVTLFR